MEDKLGLSQKLKKVNPMDEIFGLSENSEHIEYIPIEMLIHYTEHKFKLYTGQRKQDLIDSIKTHGILTPIIVVPANDGYYMILAGHNRVECGKEAGLKDIPARIMNNISKEEAKEIVMITNLFQRSFSELPISEKAEIIADYYSLLKERGKNISDIENEMQKFSELSPVGTGDKKGTVSPLGTLSLNGTRQVGQEYSLSKNSIARLLRINMLIPELKNRVDVEEISIRAGVDLSYLAIEEQVIIEDIIKIHNIKIDMRKSSQLKILSKNAKLTDKEIQLILLAKEKNDSIIVKTKPIKLNTNIIKKYFHNNQAQEEIQDIIEKALEKYFEEGDR